MYIASVKQALAVRFKMLSIQAMHSGTAESQEGDGNHGWKEVQNKTSNFAC